MIFLSYWLFYNQIYVYISWWYMLEVNSLRSKKIQAWRKKNVLKSCFNEISHFCSYTQELSKGKEWRPLNDGWLLVILLISRFFFSDWDSPVETDKALTSDHSKSYVSLMYISSINILISEFYSLFLKVPFLL